MLQETTPESQETPHGKQPPHLVLHSTDLHPERKGRNLAMPTARVEVTVSTDPGTETRIITVQDGDDLEARTGLPAYHGYRIGEIIAEGPEERQMLELQVNGEWRWLDAGQHLE